MPDRVIRIVVDPRGATRGARVVQRDLKKIEGGAQRTSSALGFLRRALLSLGVALSVRELVRYADTFTLVQNRLKLVTSGTEELKVVTDELFATAQRTRSSFESTAELFARVARSSKQLGLSQRELLDVTESVNQAVQISGATGAEASAGLIQFAQGLASGALRGDELRSVLEQLPRLAEAIATGLGITVGQLRTLGAEGRLTAQDVIGAIQSQAGTLAEEFSKVQITVGGALTQLNNSLILFIGEFDKATGASAALANAISFVAENFEVAAKVIGSISVGIAFAFGPRLVGLLQSATVAVRAFTIALAANPIGLIAVAVSSAVTALILFRNEILPIPGSIASIGDIASVVFSRFSGAVEALVDLLAVDLSGAIDEFGDRFGAVGEVVVGIIRFLIDEAKELANTFINTFRVITATAGAVADLFSGQAVGDLGQQIQDIFSEDVVGNFATSAIASIRQIGGSVLDEAEGLARARAAAGAGGPGVDLTQRPEGAASKQVEFTKQQTTALARLRDELDPVGAAQRELAAGQQLLNDALAAGKITTEESVELNKRLKESLEDQLDPIGALNREIERERELLTLTAVERQAENALREASVTVTDKQRAALRGQLVELEMIKDQLESQRDILDEIRGPQEEYANRTAALQELLRQGVIDTEQFNDKLRETRIAFLEASTSAEAGFERGLLRAQEQFNDFGAVAEETVTKAFKGAEDALVSFTETGKLDFASLTDSILQDLQRLAIRQAIIAPLINALSGGGGAGGIAASLGGGGGGGFDFGSIAGLAGGFLGGLQKGGVTDGATIAGEGRQREAVVPLPDNRSIPVKLQEPPQATQPEVNITIANVLDRRMLASMATQPDVINEITANMLNGGVSRKAIRRSGGR